MNIKPAVAEPGKVVLKWDKNTLHRIRLWMAWAAAACFLGWIIPYGFPYYRLDLAGRSTSPLHAALRPSGTIGLKLGMLGLSMFCFLFLYSIRKRWPWLSKIGKTKHWLDFHVLFGVMAPLVITLHSSFKVHGLAGVAYWVMMAVAMSGFVGRYLYAQIPRRVTATEITIKELEAESARLAEELERQALLNADHLASFRKLPTRAEVESLPLPGVILRAIWLDVSRPFRVSRLRRRLLGPGRIVLTLGGLLPSGNAELEGVISAVRMQSWLAAKLLFLSRMHEVFHLWHVVHRPFSYSFIVLVTVHVIVALLFGYY